MNLITRIMAMTVMIVLTNQLVGALNVTWNSRKTPKMTAPLTVPDHQ